MKFVKHVMYAMYVFLVIGFRCVMGVWHVMDVLHGMYVMRHLVCVLCMDPLVARGFPGSPGLYPGLWDTWHPGVHGGGGAKPTKGCM